MTGYHLSRARLRRDAPAAALAPVLLPDSMNERASVGHRLIWTLFGDNADRRRDFLWREEGALAVRPGGTSFLILSARPPEDRHALFDLETKPFEPVLAKGDRLAFTLRANPVVTRKDESGRARRHDVVMDRLRPLMPGTRAASRADAMWRGGRDWLTAQGARYGFEILQPDQVWADGYDQLRLERRGGHRPITISVLDLKGTLRVVEPGSFVQALLSGFGKAKAFGCGLMLIRRI